MFAPTPGEKRIRCCFRSFPLGVSTFYYSEIRISINRLVFVSVRVDFLLLLGVLVDELPKFLPKLFPWKLRVYTIIHMAIRLEFHVTVISEVWTAISHSTISLNCWTTILKLWRIEISQMAITVRGPRWRAPARLSAASGAGGRPAGARSGVGERAR